MKMEENMENNIPFDLISRVLSNDASAEEIQQLSHWRNESEANEIEYSNLASIMVEVPSDVPTFDVNKAWDKVSAQINVESKPNRKGLSYFKLGLVGCIIGLLGLFIWPTDSELTQKYVAKSDGEILWLPDSSKLTLKKGAQVEYLADFKGRYRNVFFKGEAFFQVKRDTSKSFIIDMGGPTVVVLGTSFNIKSGEHRTEVVVNSGKVAFSKVDPRINKVKKHVLLKDDALIYDASSDEMKAPSNIDPTTLFYATKTLVFKKTKMRDLVKVLSSVYNEQIEIHCESLAEETFKGRFEDDSLEEVFQHLSLAMDVEFEKVEEKIILTNEACK